LHGDNGKLGQHIFQGRGCRSAPVPLASLDGQGVGPWSSYI
jgi:hypothetical protein